MKNWEYIKVGKTKTSNRAGKLFTEEERARIALGRYEEAIKRGYGVDYEKKLAKEEIQTLEKIARGEAKYIGFEEKDIPDAKRAIEIYKKILNRKTGNESIDKQEWSMFSGLKKDAEKEIGNSDTVSEYNSEIQRLTKKAEQLRRMGQGKSAIEVEKQIEKLGKELRELGNKEIGNRESLVGKYVWVRSKGDEWKCYVLQDHGNKLYIQDTDGHLGWVSIERVTGVVKNKKTGNSFDAGSRITIRHNGKEEEVKVLKDMPTSILVKGQSGAVVEIKKTDFEVVKSNNTKKTGNEAPEEMEVKYKGYTITYFPYQKKYMVIHPKEVSGLMQKHFTSVDEAKKAIDKKLLGNKPVDNMKRARKSMKTGNEKTVTSFKVDVEQGDEQATIEVYKDYDGRWKERIDSGRLSGFRSAGYMGYLKPKDIITWLKRDFDYVGSSYDEDFEED